MAASDKEEEGWFPLRCNVALDVGGFQPKVYLSFKVNLLMRTRDESILDVHPMCLHNIYRYTYIYIYIYICISFVVPIGGWGCCA